MSEQDNNTPADAQEAEAIEPKADESFDASRAMDKIRKANAEAKALRERLKAEEERSAQAGDLAKQLEELRSQVSPLQAENLRLDVALELGLPRDVARRLVGSSREELMADAESLVALLTPKAAPRSTRPVESLQTGSGKAGMGPTQLSRDDLRGMSPEAITKAKAEGRLNTLLGIT